MRAMIKAAAFSFLCAFLKYKFYVLLFSRQHSTSLITIKQTICFQYSSEIELAGVILDALL